MNENGQGNANGGGGTLQTGAYNYMITPNQFGFTSQAITVLSEGGTQWSIQEQVSQSPNKGSKKRIGPKLYFNYVKSKLNKTETKKLKSRLTKLQSLVKNADETGQKALYEEFSRMLMVAVKESEIAACGHGIYVNEVDIDKFRHTVTENDDSNLNPVFFKKLEEFPRPIPAKISKVVKAVQARGLFDELWVLYLDYTKETIKSNKEKIREKDPILFGRLKYDPKKFYFIVDWVDEHCDLTLSKFVDELKENDPHYDTSQIEDVTPEYLDRIKTEMKEREERLKSTHRGNFKDLMEEEDKVELKRLKEENAKLKEDERHRLEDREIAIEKALRDRQNWRNEASKEAGHENLIDPMAKKPWWKRFF